MKVVLVIALALAAAVAAPPPLSPESTVTLTKYSNENYPNGAYKFSYELSDGSTREEVGEVKNEGQEDQYLFVKGSYAYIGTDNVSYRINYEASPEGYKPEVEEGPGGAIPPSVAASLLGG